MARAAEGDERAHGAAFMSGRRAYIRHSGGGPMGRSTVTGFEERERGEEARYRHDLELAFRVRNRRNKLLGLWVAEEHLGRTGEAAMAYAKEVVMADFDGPGDNDVLRRVETDMAAAGRGVTREQLGAKLIEAELRAKREVHEE